MKDAEEIEKFIPIFETSLRINKIPQPLWKQQLLTHLPLDTLVKIEDVLQADDSTYEEAVGALRGTTALSFCSAAEDMCSGDRGLIWDMDIRHGSAKMLRLIETVAGEAENKREMAQSFAVALIRDHLNPQLKNYMDTSRRFGFKEFLETCEEWERSQPRGTSCYKKTRVSSVAQGRVQGSNPYPVKKPLTCFTCGKTGHMSRECQSHPQGEAVTAPVVAEAPAAPAGTQKKNNVTCFRCHQKGHKSPYCPSRPKSNRRVKLQSDKLLYLQPNELFGQVGRHSMPITCDSGAQISVAPEESVEASEFTGETQTLEDFHTGKVTGRICNVIFTIAGKQFPKRAVTLPGELLRWTLCMAVPLDWKWTSSWSRWL